MSKIILFNYCAFRCHLNKLCLNDHFILGLFCKQIKHRQNMVAISNSLRLMLRIFETAAFCFNVFVLIIDISAARLLLSQSVTIIVENISTFCESAFSGN